MDIIHVASDPESGFEYPYYFHIPEQYTGNRPILVEPTSTGKPSDNFDEHQEIAKLRARGGTGRRIADELEIPYLHPVFPRPVSDPVDWTHSVHQLCARTIRLEDGPLARIDLQLLAMIDHARKEVADVDHQPPEGIILNGFSASGAFANRFCVLHPDRVHSVSAGGLSGIMTLPRATGERGIEFGLAEPLVPNYPVGVADVDSLTGNQFDMASFREVPQFYYMGEDDEKDVLLWPDAWTDPELRASAILTYGTDILQDRFPFCASVYRDENVPAIFRVYPKTGHQPSPAIDDIVTFHERVLANEQIETFNDELGGKPV